MSLVALIKSQGMPLMNMFRLRMDDITVCDVNGKLLLTNPQNYYPTLSTKVFSISSPIIVVLCAATPSTVCIDKALMKKTKSLAI